MLDFWYGNLRFFLFRLNSTQPVACRAVSLTFSALNSNGPSISRLFRPAIAQKVTLGIYGMNLACIGI
jgi:hypothetical protein